MRAGRLMRHAAALHLKTRWCFAPGTLRAIEAAIARAERAHGGEIRFAIETSLPPRRILADITPRMRALEVFSLLRVWDTEHNNGVLIYVLMADRSVEIVADRGVSGRVSGDEWGAVCRMMEEHFREGRFREGSTTGIDAVGGLLARHFPASPAQRARSPNELPDQPTLL
ncbi:MAG TPA: TPM domain-containing protein [Steroidobacteraceae bacterium]|nr:TPM domain-containing protein [Steroidobacteraceae bacterium]